MYDLTFEFLPLSENDWKDKLIKELKDKPLESLIWNPENGIELQALYAQSAQDGLLQDLVRTKTWSIDERIIVDNNLKEANKIALVALEFGANSISFFLNQNLTLDQLSLLLHQIEPKFIELYFELGNELDGLNFLNIFEQWTKNQDIEPSEMEGGVFIPNDQVNSSSFKLLYAYKTKYAKLKFFLLSPQATDKCNELTSLLIQAAQLFDGLTNANWNADVINNSIQFSIPIYTDYFYEISKLQAFALLWKAFAYAYSFTWELPEIYARCSTQSFTADPNTNRIKTTTQAMSAAIGGVSRMNVPSAVENDDFSRRIARNVQHLLQQESYLHKVANPSAGAYYIEQFSHQIMHNTWTNFLKSYKK